MFSYSQILKGFFTSTLLHIRTSKTFHTEELKSHTIKEDHHGLQNILQGFEKLPICKGVCLCFSLHKTLKLFFFPFSLLPLSPFHKKNNVEHLFLIISIVEAFLHYDKNPTDGNLIWWVIEKHYKQLLMLFFAVWHAS